MKQTLFAIAGAVVGGILGYYGCGWMLKYRLHALALPGGLLGIGASIGKTRSIWLPVGFGLAALALGIFTEWKHFPFVKDDSLTFFVLHLTDNDPVTLLLIAIGGALGFWIPYRRADPPNRAGR